MLELLSSPVIKRAFISLLVAGAFLPIAGSFNILTRTSFFAAGISHIALAGIALAFVVGLDPLFCAFLVSMLATFLVWKLGKRGFQKYEENLSILFSFFMALAIFFFGLSKTYTSDAMSYLFGSPLGVTSLDLYLIISLFVLYLLFIVLFRRELFHVILSPELSQAVGINVSLVNLLLFFATTLAVLMSMKVVGALVVFGLTVIPSATTLRVSKHFYQQLVLSAIIGVFASFLGFIISMILDIPTGSSVVVVSTIFYVLSLLKKK